jgi:hypothetical protein
MKIHPVGTEVFHVDRETGRHDKANGHFSQFAKVPKITINLKNT